MANNYSSINPEGQQGLRTYIDGKPDGPTIVFVHGWPDDHALWDKQVMHVCMRESSAPVNCGHISPVAT